MRLKNLVETKQERRLDETTIGVIAGDRLSNVVTSMKVPANFTKLEKGLAMGKFEGDVYRLYTSLFEDLKAYKKFPCIVDYEDGIELQIINIIDNVITITTYNFWDAISDNEGVDEDSFQIIPEITDKRIELPFDPTILLKYL